MEESIIIPKKPSYEELEQRIKELEKETLERRRVEKALQRTKEELETIVDSVPALIAYKDSKNRYIRINKSYAEAINLPRDHIEGKSAFDIASNREFAERYWRDDKEVIASGTPKRNIVEPLVFDETKTGQTDKIPYRDDEGNILGVIVFCIDITSRVRAEKALRDRTEALERSNRELEQFAYVASHDLQEPLRMVASYTQLLAKRYKGKLDADADEFIAYAVDGATRMQALINDLLTYSRVGTRGKDFKPTNSEAVLERTLKNLQNAVEESGAKVTYDTLPTLMADDMQLGQLFQNLIGNALRFHGEEPPRIHVSAQKNENQWVFSVHDNGIGIDPEFTERIFIIFQRLHKRREYPGTGIGLAICKKIVERHGGRIWVESKPEKGSTFYFTIPLRGENSHE
jgi:PAS domain S-box-containing protein